MPNVMDYLRWRGDLSFARDPFNEVDAVVFANLSYLRLEGSAAQYPYIPLRLADAAEEFFHLPDAAQRGRGTNDLELLKLAARTTRFGSVRLVRYRSQFIPEEDTQFAAETFLLDDGSIVIAFRGTDNTLVGWKEDFNMSFQQTVPSQRLALDYVRELYSEYLCPIRICGHSKGGNLAVFSAARSSPMIQDKIESVYNFDGPGFTSYMMGDPGYLAMVPKIHTFVPQSSIIGMLMEREEPIRIVHSNQVSILQHDTLSWDVMGKELAEAPELTSDARFIKATIQNWLLEMDLSERNEMVEALFSLLTNGNVEKAADIFNLKNLRNYLKVFGTDDSIRKVLSGEMDNLLDAARKTMKSAPAPQELEASSQESTEQTS